MSNTWNQSGTTWGSNQWGEQGPTVVTLTGLSTTSSVGTLVLSLGVPLTGVSATSAVGSISPADVMGLTGLSTTSSVGFNRTFNNVFSWIRIS